MELNSAYRRQLRADFFQILRSAHGLTTKDINPNNAEKCCNALKQLWTMHQPLNCDNPAFREWFLATFRKEINAYKQP